MPFCTECGAANPETARFCDQCGASLVQVAGTAAAPPPVPPTAAPPAAGTTCPQCGTPTILGEAFCDNCGAPLFSMPSAPSEAPAPVAPAFAPSSARVPPQASYPPPQAVDTGAAAPVPMPAPAAPTPAHTTLAAVRLLVVGSGAVVTLPDKAQAIVGRADPVSHFYPDVDLQPHGAMDQGVGRRHVRLVVQQQQLLVEDLESTNGSFLNRERLAPRQPAPLQPGDELRLGNMVLQVQH